MPAWPTYAKITTQGYGEQSDYGVLESDTDAPVPKARRRWSVQIVTRTVSFYVTSNDDKRAFDAWYRDDVNGGVSWFDFVIPATAIIVQARIVGGAPSWGEPQAEVWTATCRIATIGG